MSDASRTEASLPAGRELAGWIASCLADVPGENALVLLGGTGRVSRRLKAQGRQILAYDSSWSHHLFALAMLPDGRVEIGADRLADWLRPPKDAVAGDRFGAWAGREFTREEALWLEVWRSRILEADLPPRLAAKGAVAVMKVMSYWLAWNRDGLCHKPLPRGAVLRHCADELDRATPIPGTGCEARRAALGAVLSPEACDLLYCYVPPAAGMNAMDRRLAFWERWVLGAPGAHLDFDIQGQLGGTLADDEDRASAVGRLLERMVDIPTWSLAYSGQGDAIAVAVERFRPLTFRQEVSVPYPHGQGSTIMREGLIVAKRAA